MMARDPFGLWACAMAMSVGACSPSVAPQEPEPAPAIVVEPSAEKEEAATPSMDVVSETPEPEDPPPMKEGDIEDGRPMRDARKAFQVGLEAFKAGDFALARQHFEESYRLSNKAALLFNLVRAAVKEGNTTAACGYYQQLEQRAAQDPSLSKMLSRLADPC